MYDMIMIGGGPAGLTAAIYGRRAGRSVLVIEKDAFGGQITFSPRVENIPGFTSISGSEFAEKLVDQAIAQECEFENAEILAIERTDAGTFICRSEDESYEGRTVILAAGTKHRMLGLEREEAFIGEGISFCAVCDGAFYQDEVVGVVGGGNSALQEALLLSELARKVYVFQDLDHLTGEQKLQEALLQQSNVTVRTGVRVSELLGEEALTGVKVRDRSGHETAVALTGLFVAIGLVPQNEAFGEMLELDGRGYAIADETCRTQVPGLFVEGDCRTKGIRQVTTAAADGASAALAANDYLGA